MVQALCHRRVRVAKGTQAMKRNHHLYMANPHRTACGVRLDSISDTTKGASGPQIGWHGHRRYFLAYTFLAGGSTLEFKPTCKACLAVDRGEKRGT